MNLKEVEKRIKKARQKKICVNEFADKKENEVFNDGFKEALDWVLLLIQTSDAEVARIEKEHREWLMGIKKGE